MIKRMIKYDEIDDMTKKMKMSRGHYEQNSECRNVLETRHASVVTRAKARTTCAWELLHKSKIWTVPQFAAKGGFL